MATESTTGKSSVRRTAGKSGGSVVAHVFSGRGGADAWRYADRSMAPSNDVVRYAVLLKNLGQSNPRDTDIGLDAVRAAVHHGFARSSFDRLKELTDLSTETLAGVIGTPLRTLARRTRFRPDESERIFRVAAVFQRTLEVFGDLEGARRWFSEPKRALDEHSPLEYCDTDLGAREVEHLLGRIEHGVFS